MRWNHGRKAQSGNPDPPNRIPTVKLEIPGKAFLKSETRISVTFELQFFTLAIYQWQPFGLSKYSTMKNIKKSKFTEFTLALGQNYNLDVTEILVSDFKNAFPGFFNFTVGILLLTSPKRFKIFLTVRLEWHNRSFSKHDC